LSYQQRIYFQQITITSQTSFESKLSHISNISKGYLNVSSTSFYKYFIKLPNNISRIIPQSNKTKTCELTNFIDDFKHVFQVSVLRRMPLPHFACILGYKALGTHPMTALLNHMLRKYKCSYTRAFPPWRGVTDWYQSIGYSELGCLRGA